LYRKNKEVSYLVPFGKLLNPTERG